MKTFYTRQRIVLDLKMYYSFLYDQGWLFRKELPHPNRWVEMDTRDLQALLRRVKRAHVKLCQRRDAQYWAYLSDN